MVAPLIAPSAAQEPSDANFGGPNASQMLTLQAQSGQQPVAPITPITTPSTPTGPAKEPTVVSSSNITDNVIPDLHKQADAISQKGTYVGQDGKTYYSDGSAVPAPTDAEYDPKTGSWTSNGTTYSAAPQYVDNPDNDPDVAKTNELFDSLKSSLDSNTLTQVNAIQQQYDMLKNAQQDANNRANSARTTLNLRTGTTQFAPLDAAGTALAQTSYGLQQIAKLDADENSAIAQVKAAQQSGNFQLMQQALNTAQAARTAKQAAAQKVQDQLSAANDAVLKQQQQSAQDDAVAQLVSQGISDPSEVLKQLTTAGYTATASDVADSLKALTPTASKGDTYKFSASQTGKMLAAGLSPDDVQAVQDYYNGNGDASALDNLSSDQLATVHAAMNGTTIKSATAAPAKSYTSGSYTYTSTDLGKIQSWITATKGPDGYVDPNAYKQAFDAWTNDGALAKDFLKNFPPKTLINPVNDWLPKYLQSKTGGSSSSSDISTQISGLFTNPQ